MIYHNSKCGLQFEKIQKLFFIQFLKISENTLILRGSQIKKRPYPVYFKDGRHDFQ